MITFQPKAAARVVTTEAVEGCRPGVSQIVFRVLSETAAWAREAASAAAVPSSRREALAISMPVSSRIMV